MPRKTAAQGLKQEVQETFEAAVATQAATFKQEAVLAKQRLLERMQKLLTGLDGILKAEKPASAPGGEPMDRLIAREARLRAHLEQTPRLQEILKQCGKLREALSTLMTEKSEAMQVLGMSESPTDPTILDQDVSVLQLCPRSQKRMVRLGVHTVRALTLLNEAQLMDGAKNFGPSSMNDIRMKLARHGHKLRGE